MKYRSLQFLCQLKKPAPRILGIDKYHYFDIMEIETFIVYHRSFPLEMVVTGNDSSGNVKFG